jgi:hypothetical protein
MKPRLKDLLKAHKEALRKAPPKSRDRLRHRVAVLQKVAQLKRESRSAA